MIEEEAENELKTLDAAAEVEKESSPLTLVLTLTLIGGGEGVIRGGVSEG